MVWSIPCTGVSGRSVIASTPLAFDRCAVIDLSGRSIAASFLLFDNLTASRGPSIFAYFWERFTTLRESDWASERFEITSHWIHFGDLTADLLEVSGRSDRRSLLLFRWCDRRASRERVDNQLSSTANLLAFESTDRWSLTTQPFFLSC